MNAIPKSLLLFGAMLFLTALALAFRLPELARKPMHTDEAVQAAKAGVLYDQGIYRYDPHEFHGPTLYYLTQPVLALSGVKSYADSSEWHYRIVTVIFGVGLILLSMLVADGLGLTAMFCAGVLTAVSPAFVYYSRYYIQEVPLVFFSFAAIACVWRWINAIGNWRWFWAGLAGASVGLAHATKETCVIVFASAFVAGVFNFFSCARARENAIVRLRQYREVALFVFAAVALSAIFYSSFFTHARGPLDSILTYGQYLSRGTSGADHAKAWDYYARLIAWNPSVLGVWTELFIAVLAVIGSVATFRRTSNGLARFFLVYTVSMLLVYSVIAYKTPWCVLGILHGMIVLAGIGATALIELAPRVWMKIIVVLALLAGTAHLAWQANRAAFKFASDARNPYVYSHPTQDTARLCERIEALSRVHPDGENMLVQVMAPKSDYWPVPWYLRRLKRVGFWDAPPANLNAPVLLTKADFVPELRLELKKKYQVNLYSIRPGVLLQLYVEEGLWKEFLAKTAASKR